MTKEEYAYIIVNKIKDINDEIKKQKSILELFNNDESVKEVIEANRRIAYLKNEKEQLKELLYLPLVVRINSATNEEYEDYKQSEKRRIEFLLEQAIEELKCYEKKIEQLTLEKEEFNQEFDDDNGSKVLNDIKSQIFLNNIKIRKVNQTINRCNKELARLDTLTVEEIKSELLSRINIKNLNLDERNNSLIAYLYNDGDTRKKIEFLLKKYKDLENISYSQKVEYPLKAARMFSKLGVVSWFDGSDNNKTSGNFHEDEETLMNIDSLMEDFMYYIKYFDGSLTYLNVTFEFMRDFPNYSFNLKNLDDLYCDLRPMLSSNVFSVEEKGMLKKNYIILGRLINKYEEGENSLFKIGFKKALPELKRNIIHVLFEISNILYKPFINMNNFAYYYPLDRKLKWDGVYNLYSKNTKMSINNYTDLAYCVNLLRDVSQKQKYTYEYLKNYRADYNKAIYFSRKKKSMIDSEKLEIEKSIVELIDKDRREFNSLDYKQFMFNEIKTAIDFINNRSLENEFDVMNISIRNSARVEVAEKANEVIKEISIGELMQMRSEIIQKMNEIEGNAKRV